MTRPAHSGQLRMLLTAERSPASRNPGITAVIVGLANLFFSAYMEQYMTGDPSGHYLALFLWTELTLLVAVTLLGFLKSGMAVLAKTSLFPIGPWTTLMFILRSNIGRPMSKSLLLTSMFAIAVHYRHSYSVLSTVLSAYLLLILLTELLTAIACSRMARGRDAGGVPLLVGLAAAVLAATSLLVPGRPILVSLPGMSWAIDAILSARIGNGEAAIIQLSLLSMSAILMTFIARRTL